MLPIPSNYCSKNWTCQIDQTVPIICTADAHHVKIMAIHFEDCDTLDECYNLQKNEVFIEGTLAMLAQPTHIDKLVPGTGRIVQAERDENLNIDEEFSTNEPNRIESLNLWTVKRSLRMKKFHLVICYASNEKGDHYQSKILLPSDLEHGRLHEVRPHFMRGPTDTEIVEGDDFSLQFRYSNILYNSNRYTLDVKPQGSTRCELDTSIVNREQYHHISLYDNDKSLDYTKVVELRFKNIIQDCSYNYSIELQVNSDAYAKTKGIQNNPIRPVIAYAVNVLSSIKPYFVVNHQTGVNKTVVHVSNSTNANETSKYVVAYSDIDVESDETVELNCENRGRPKPTVMWFKDSRLLNLTDEKYRFDPVASSLRIVRTHAVDSGKYHCDVANKFGEITRAFDVKVESDVLIVRKLTKKQIVSIVLISVFSFFLLIMLIIAVAYAYQQRRERINLDVSLTLISNGCYICPKYF